MADESLYLTEAHLDAFVDLALRSNKPQHELLAAFACIGVNAKGRTSEILGMKRHAFVTEHPEFRYYISRKGVLRERLFFTMASEKEIEITRRWLSKHDQATNGDTDSRIWHRINFEEDGIHLQRNLAPLSRTYVGKIASYIAKLLHLPNWKLYKNRSFRLLSVRRPSNANGTVTNVQF